VSQEIQVLGYIKIDICSSKILRLRKYHFMKNGWVHDTSIHSNKSFHLDVDIYNHQFTM